ncbi:MAG TPA: tetratricopeptide repeat protein [Gammaproteobacteria bacterium]|nr:tetratricopeptide repeat protein [Gammaproteobacteria bacterium]
MQNRWITVSDKAVVRLTVLALLKRNVMALLLILSGVSVILSVIPGCSYVQPVKTQPGILPVADNDDMPSALTDLMVQADQQYMKGEYQAALSTLERALRIKPRYPEVWSRMAQVYASQGDTKQAQQHAERSNSFIKNNDSLKAFNQKFIDASQP